MSGRKSDDNELLNYIATTVETMREQTATKDDLAAMATKDDLAAMATKDDLAAMATKDDLAAMATKDDLAAMATKDDLRQVEFRLGVKLEGEIKAVRGDIEQVHLRLNTIERALTTRLNQIETELSRLRSVVYLLAKDKPELLRLLGQDTPPS